MKLVWSRALDSQTIQQRNSRLLAENIWQITWYLIAISGALALALLLWQNINQPAELLVTLISHGISQIGFWLGLVAGLFMLKSHFLKQTVKPAIHKIYTEKKHQKITIDHFFSQATLTIIDQACLNQQKNKRPTSWLPFYLLAELIKARSGQMFLDRLGLDSNKIEKKIKQFLIQGNLNDNNSGPDALKILIYQAFTHAVQIHAEQVKPSDLIWALGQTPSAVRDFISDQGIEPSDLRGVSQWLRVRDQLVDQRGKLKHSRLTRTKPWRNSLWTSTVTPLLDSIGRDLTAEAATYYPLINRHEEFEKIFSLVETGAKGLLLLGLKGAGVSKMVEGLAQKIMEQSVPPSLADRRVHTVSLAKLLALSNSQTTVKALTQELAKEIKRSGNIVLILEDLPDLEEVKTEEAVMILEQLVLDTLRDDNLILLATAEPNQLHQSRSQLMNSLQIVEVKPLDQTNTLLILETMAPYLEVEYGVTLTYQALKQTADLSRFLHDLAQPAQAVQALRRICEEFRVTHKAKLKHQYPNQLLITADFVEQMISSMSKLPLTQASDREAKILLGLESLISQKYVNQARAVKAVAAALRRARTSLRDERRPIGSFLFLGPTGVGKTELAKRLAEIYFQSPDNMIRLDMTEYQEAQAIRGLIGTPPGTGSATEGSLIKAVKAKPFAVILLDELEKAHPDILNIFLQVMEDARLTSSQGETYDFSHTIIIGTSNAGAVFVQKAVEAGMTQAEIDEALKKRELLHSFKPEFINRFDAVVTFAPLSFEHVVTITRLLLNELADRLAEQGFAFEAETAAVQDLATAGYNPAQGARPLRRVIQDRIEDQIAKLILNKKIRQRDKIILKKDFVIEVKEAVHY